MNLAIEEKVVSRKATEHYGMVWDDACIGTDPQIAPSQYVTACTYKHWIGFPSDHPSCHYSSQTISMADKQLLARFRCGCHQLRIQTGRYSRPKEPRALRLCQACAMNVVEDVHHFLLECPAYAETRQQFHHIFAHGSLVITTKYILAHRNQRHLAACIKDMLRLQSNNALNA